MKINHCASNIKIMREDNIVHFPLEVLLLPNDLRDTDCTKLQQNNYICAMQV